MSIELQSFEEQRPLMSEMTDHKNEATAESGEPTMGEGIAAGIDSAAAIPKGTIDPVYEAKARVLNHAIQEIGMGW